MTLNAHLKVSVDKSSTHQDFDEGPWSLDEAMLSALKNAFKISLQLRWAQVDNVTKSAGLRQTSPRL